MRKIFVILVFMSIVGQNSYVAAEKINRQIVETETLNNSPKIAISKLELDNARQQYNIALSGFFPKVGFFCKKRLSYNNYDRCLYGFKIDLPIFEGFSTYNKVRKEAAGVKIAEALYNRAIADAIYESSVKYIDLMSEYENIELLYKTKKRMEENRDIVKLKYNSGLVDISVLKMAEIDILKIDHNLKVAKKNIALYSASLLKFMGRNDDSTLLETDERVNIYYKKLPMEPNYCDVIAAMPEFLIAKYNFDMHRASRAEARGRMLPSLVFSSYLEKKYGDSKYDKQLNIFLDYTIFAGRQASSNIKIASNNFEIASKKLKNDPCSLKLNARICYNNLISALEGVNIAEQTVNVLRLKTEISLKKYISGLLKYEDWNNAEGNYMLSQTRLLQEKKDVALKSVMWKKFICEK